MDIINFEKEKMIPLTKQQRELPENSEICYICKKTFESKNCRKVRDYCHHTRKFRGAAHSKCNLKYNVLNEIL